MTVEIGLLGPISVVQDGAPVPVGAEKLRALVAFLALHCGSTVSMERLAGALWDGVHHHGAAPALRVYVSQLRKLFVNRDVVVTRPSGYAMVLEPASVDVARFEQGCRQARAQVDPDCRARMLRDALALWRGPALEDLAAYPWAADERRRLDEARLLAVEERIEADLACGRAADVVVELATLTVHHPFRERLWRQRIVALAQCGRQAEALAAYQDVRRRLADELGIDPSPPLRDLEHAVLTQRVELVPEGPPMAGAPVVDRPGNLPVEVSSFVGRSGERVAVASALRGHRIVTVTGVAGVGKSRLALRVAADVRAGFTGGAWWCDLTSVQAPESVPRQLITTLEVPGRTVADPHRALLRFLAERSLLLVLDNGEHLLPTVAELANDIAVHCPGVRILVTSREPLSVEGETVLSILGLPGPDPDAADAEARAADAVQLFLDRARAADSAFVPTERGVQAMAEICRRLDGLPLAIELAAARVPAMNLDDILAHLDDRYRLLTGGRRTAAGRHQTLREAVDRSYELLDERQRRTFERVSVFAGGFTVGDAEVAVRDDGIPDGIDDHDVLDLVTQLVGKSLLQVETADDVETRYRMLETIRQYAEHRLRERGDEETVRERCRRHHLRLAADA